MAGITFGLSAPEALERFRDVAKTILRNTQTYNDETKQLLEEKAKNLGVHLLDAETIIEELAPKHLAPEFTPQIEPVGPVSSLLSSPLDHRGASGSDKDKTLTPWDDVARIKEESPRVFKGHSDSVRSVVFSPDGRFALSGSEDKTMRLWDIASGRCLRVFKRKLSWVSLKKSTVNSVAFSPDGRFALSGNENKTMCLWNIASGSCQQVFKGHSGSVNAVSFSPDDRYAMSGSEDGTLRLWDIASGGCLRVFEMDGLKGYSHAIALSLDGFFALSTAKLGADEVLLLWDIPRRKCLRRFFAPKGKKSIFVSSIAFSPDGRQALLGNFFGKPSMILWDIASGECVRIFKSNLITVNSIAFSQDGRYALSGGVGDGICMFLWDIASGECMRIFKSSLNKNDLMYVDSVAFSPNGCFALSGNSDHTLRLWDITT